MPISSRLLSLSLISLALFASRANALTYTYDNSTAGAIANNSCANPLTRTFTVSDSFTVSEIAIGLNISHNNRGDLRATLVAPDATTRQFVTESGDSDNNYDIYVSTNTEGALDDGDSDPVAEPYYNRMVSLGTMNFYTGSSAGTWTLRVCDTNGGTSGTFKYHFRA